MDIQSCKSTPGSNVAPSEFYGPAYYLASNDYSIFLNAWASDLPNRLNRYPQWVPKEYTQTVKLLMSSTELLVLFILYTIIFNIKPWCEKNFNKGSQKRAENDMEKLMSHKRLLVLYILFTILKKSHLVLNMHQN